MFSKSFILVYIFLEKHLGWLSRKIHNYFYKDYDQTLCSRACMVEYKGIWIIFKPARNHCMKSYQKWSSNGRTSGQN